MKLVLILVFAFLLFSCANKAVVQKPMVVQKSLLVEKPIIQQEIVGATTIENRDGKKIFENKCGNCHRLYSPNEFSKTEWIPILKRMRIQADLSEEDIAVVQEYIFKDLK